MELDSLYEGIMIRGIDSVRKQKEYVDHHIDDMADTRMGITLVIRPTAEINERISRMEEELRKIEPEQYYYPQEDYHITLLDILTARQGFAYTKEQVSTCRQLSEEVIRRAKPFTIHLKGIVLSEGAVMVKGYYENEMEHLRRHLREAIINYGMQLDERYPTISSHVTIARFRTEIKLREQLIDKISEYKELEIGTFPVSQIDLICHNWYDSKKEVLSSFLIGRLHR